MTKLLSDRIKELHLRPNAPYPSEVQDAHEMILEWRRTQQLHKMQQLHTIAEGNTKGADNDDDFDGDVA